jgi:hypothetical protein
MQNYFDIAAAIQTLSRSSLVRFQLRKFTLPKAEHVRRDIAQTRNFADAKV